jgi:hypothetical protein
MPNATILKHKNHVKKRGVTDLGCQNYHNFFGSTRPPGYTNLSPYWLPGPHSPWLLHIFALWLISKCKKVKKILILLWMQCEKVSGRCLNLKVQTIWWTVPNWSKDRSVYLKWIYWRIISMFQVKKATLRSAILECVALRLDGHSTSCLCQCFNDSNLTDTTELCKYQAPRYCTSQCFHIHMVFEPL